MDIFALRAASTDRRHLSIPAEPEWRCAPSGTVESLARVLAAEQPVRLDVLVLAAAIRTLPAFGRTGGSRV